QLEKLFKNRYSLIALNIAQQFPHPDIVYQQDLETLITSILNSTDKGLSIKKAENYAKELVKLARESYPHVAKHSFLVQKTKLRIQQ
ncbi:IS110 family transposase, partial [Staphylococcus sp. SQ8-PEA]|nr:IS110 family transposase [Staphylococcus marylandisciuri]